jgi:hypothetical protein
MGGADEDLVDAHALGLGDDVGDRVRYVLGLEGLHGGDHAADALLRLLVGDAVRELGRDGPGSIMVMRMLSSWSSGLKASEMALTAHLVPEYAPCSGPVLRPATLEMLKMCPDCCSFITAMAASVVYRSPRTLTIVTVLCGCFLGA